MTYIHVPRFFTASTVLTLTTATKIPTNKYKFFIFFIHTVIFFTVFLKCFLEPHWFLIIIWLFDFFFQFHWLSYRSQKSPFILCDFQKFRDNILVLNNCWHFFTHHVLFLLVCLLFSKIELYILICSVRLCVYLEVLLCTSSVAAKRGTFVGAQPLGRTFSPWGWGREGWYPVLTEGNFGGIIL